MNKKVAKSFLKYHKLKDGIIYTKYPKQIYIGLLNHIWMNNFLNYENIAPLPSVIYRCFKKYLKDEGLSIKDFIPADLFEYFIFDDKQAEDNIKKLHSAYQKAINYL